MQKKTSSIINIGVIGGTSLCGELLEKTTVDYREKDVNARMKVVADPDPESPAVLADLVGSLRLKRYKSDPLAHLRSGLVARGEGPRPFRTRPQDRNRADPVPGHPHH